MSSNAIKLNSKPWTAFTITNTFGKSYQLIPIFDTGFVLPFNSNVNAGEVGDWIIRVKFCVYAEPRDYAERGDTVLGVIETGEYEFLPITREIITADKKVCTLTSNSLKVKVVE